MPNSKIMFITHTQRWASTTDIQFNTNNGKNSRGYIKNNIGFSLEDYTNAVKDCAGLYGYKTLDLFHESGLNKNNYQLFYESDFLHPTTKYGMILGDKISDALKC